MADNLNESDNFLAESDDDVERLTKSWRFKSISSS